MSKPLLFFVGCILAVSLAAAQNRQQEPNVSQPHSQGENPTLQQGNPGDDKSPMAAEQDGQTTAQEDPRRSFAWGWLLAGLLLIAATTGLIFIARGGLRRVDAIDRQRRRDDIDRAA
jgi:hypothetical protein